ncbi:MAG TPA: protein translocase subunit SecD [Solirubrobacteraceae bacterium]|nr:protein translocase subunit SecD [Solirubrobacteraceae bacterium]
MSERRRNLFVLLLVLGLLIASAVVLTAKPTKLGLDLQGGVELVYEAQETRQAPVTDESIGRAIDVMRERVDQLGVAEPEIQRSGDRQISVALPAVKNLAEAIDQVGTVAQLAFYDWEVNVIGPDGVPAPSDIGVTGGSAAGTNSIPPALKLYDAILRAKDRPAKVEANNSRETSLFYAVNTKTKKVYRGGKDPNGLAGENTRADALANVPRADRPNATVHEVKPDTVIIRAEQPDTSDKTTDTWYVLKDDVALKGQEIKNPEQNTDQQGGGGPIVTFEFTKKGRETWQDVTRRIAERGSESVGLLPGQDASSANQHFAIVLDDELVSTPFIDFRRNPDGIDGRTGSQIEGGFTIKSAQELANVLKTGALPLKLELISSSQVSATLGQQALDQGLTAGIAGFVIVALFLLIFYRILGVIAVSALVIYGVYFFALIKLIPVVLTLPGIAGLILTLGVAADANIVIFERVKEEIRGGRSVMAGIATGYKKGLTAIIDANVVTLMVAFILFVLATAGVKGFALTLGLGVIVSLFTAVLATQAILGTMGKSRILSSPSALGVSKPKGNRLRLNYVGYSRWFFSASGLILLVCALALGSKGINFGIDFESGTRINVALTQKTDENAVRDVLATVGQGDAEIQKVTRPGAGAGKFQISTDNLRPAEVTRVQAALDEEFDFADTPSSTSIGPTFGQTVANNAIIAIIASLLVISAYIALRFEPKYAVPVLIAVMHDILITAGIYALVGQEVSTSTVAALLTILGFSLYDTIIVFDRIRENVPRMPRAAFSQIVNRSMSEVIVRSLATSFCAALPVLALLLFGGETLQAFAFALLIGTISGTYSSVFIAAPVLTAWKEREPVYRRRRASIAAENDGLVPAFATGSAEMQVDVDRGRRLKGGARLTAPDDPEQVSKAEFDAMVRDLHADPAPRRTAVADPPATKAKPKPAEPKPAEPEAAEPDPAADALPEDTVMPARPDGAGKPKPRSAAARRKGKHGRPR